MKTLSLKIPIGHHGAVVELERDSIRVFMQEAAAAGYFQDKDVLDFGCGRQPYKELIENAGGRYTGHDPNPEYGHDRRIQADADVVIINQVLQYLEDPAHWLKLMRIALREGGILVMTYGTNWREIEASDLQRYTQAGMARLLNACGYEVLEHTRRAEVEIGAVTFALGYGVIARSRLVWRDNEAPREETDPFDAVIIPEPEAQLPFTPRGALEEAAFAMPETTPEERTAKREALHNCGIDLIGSFVVTESKPTDELKAVDALIDKSAGEDAV